MLIPVPMPVSMRMPMPLPLPLPLPLPMPLPMPMQMIPKDHLFFNLYRLDPLRLGIEGEDSEEGVQQQLEARELLGE